MKSIISELMTSKERNEYLEKGMKRVKKPGKQAITFAKHKEKKGESVTVSESDPGVRNFNNTLAECILLPIGNKGIFFEQDDDDTRCSHYVIDSKTCDVGCNKIGIDKGGKCPYLPVNSQPKCPCYMKKEQQED